jgi:hypothetical protein
VLDVAEDPFSFIMMEYAAGGDIFDLVLLEIYEACTFTEFMMETETESRKVVTNDDLFYDPDKDDDDQVWVDSVRQSYHQPGQGQDESAPAKLPSSDAVLNCPACFTVLCLDCQRHEVYNTQYRAMFVVNCTVNTEQKLKFPVKGKGKKGRGGKGKMVTDPNSDYHPVMCDNCKTEVAMYDQDEVYHFFNVVASHS